MSKHLLVPAALFAGVLTLALACVPMPVLPETEKPTPDVSKEDPTRRMQALLVRSEGRGQIQQREPLFWIYEWAVHPPLVYDRIHGGIE